MSVTTKRGRVGRIALNVFAGFGFVYLFLPIAFIVAFSFNQPKGKFNIVWQKFTLENWTDPFSDTALTDAFVTSLQIAAVSTLIATFLGSMIAIALSRYRFRGSAAYNFLLVLPLTTPEIVLGSSLATLFLGQSVVDFGFATIVIAHAMFQVSFVALTVRARIRGFDWTLEQAAQDLGASLEPGQARDIHRPGDGRVAPSPSAALECRSREETLVVARQFLPSRGAGR